MTLNRLSVSYCALISLSRHYSSNWSAPFDLPTTLRHGFFQKKTEFLSGQGLISSTDKKAFDKYNNRRNDFTHIFAKYITQSEILNLARELENLEIEFSDSVWTYSEKQAIDYYGGLPGVAAEISWCILFHAAHILSVQGCRDIFADTGNTTP